MVIQSKNTPGSWTETSNNEESNNSEPIADKTVYIFRNDQNNHKNSCANFYS